MPRPLGEGAPNNTLVHVLPFLLTRFPRKREPRTVSGLWIALYGPDGAGKSALADRLADDLGPFFPGLRLHHLRLPLWQSSRKSVMVTQPHAQPPRCLTLSCLKLFYMFAQSWLAHLLHVLSWLGSGQLVIVDRYFLDYTIDPQRYRLARSSVRLASLLGRFAPRPDLQFVLDVPAEELQRRKPEVSLCESRRQRYEYAARIARLPNGRLVNADRPMLQVELEITTAILQLQQRRFRAVKQADLAPA